MPIAAASDALVRHLRARLREAGAPDAGNVQAMTLREARTESGRGAALVLWRVQPDRPEPDGDLPARIASKADPPDGGGLVLRYLLLARGGDGRAEQAMLGHCMAALHRHPVVEGPGASPGGVAAEALVVTMEALPDDAYLALVAACGDPPALMVPYAARNVRLLPPAAGRVPDSPGTDPL